MKKQKCRLIFHGPYKEIDMGVFESKAAAKKYLREVSNIWSRPYSIKPIN